MRRLIALGCLSYLVIGFGHVAVGSVMEQLIAAYGRDYEAGGQLVMNQFLGFLAGVLLSPWVIRSWGRRHAIRLSFVLFAVAVGGYALEPSWGVMLILALLAGYGFGMGETCIGAFVIDVIAAEKKASAMSLLEVFFGLGALLLPAAAAGLIALDRWIWTFGLTAATGVAALLLWLFLPLGEASAFMGRSLPERETAAADADAIASVVPAPAGYGRHGLPLLALGALFFAIYVGMEMSFANYLPAIMGRKSGLSESSAALTLSLFWAAVSLGRMFVGRVSTGLGYRRFLTFSCAGALLGFAGLSAWDGPIGSLGLIVFTGLSMAGIFAIGLVYLNEAFPGRTDRTTSILIACGGLGGALLPKLAGWMMDRYDAVYTVWQTAGFALLLLIVMRLISQARYRKERRTSAHVQPE